MRCPFCGKTFDEQAAQAAQAACRSCAVFGGCRKLKCPHCAYEMPQEPRLVGWLRKKLTGRHDHS